MWLWWATFLGWHKLERSRSTVCRHRQVRPPLPPVPGRETGSLPLQFCSNCFLFSQLSATDPPSEWAPPFQPRSGLDGLCLAPRPDLRDAVQWHCSPGLSSPSPCPAPAEPWPPPHPALVPSPFLSLIIYMWNFLWVKILMSEHFAG